MDSKSIFTSKTFYLGLFSPVVGWLITKFGLNMPPDMVSAIVEALSVASAAFIGNRFFTSQPVHLVPPAP